MNKELKYIFLCFKVLSVVHGSPEVTSWYIFKHSVAHAENSTLKFSKTYC
jgi:hypothetical protein